MEALLQIVDPYEPGSEVFATQRIKDIEIIPSVDEYLIITSKSADEWEHSVSLRVIGVTAFADLRTYAVALELPAFEEDPAGIYLDERKFRRLLGNNRWAVHQDRRPLPHDFDLDDYEEDADTIANF